MKHGFAIIDFRGISKMACAAEVYLMGMRAGAFLRHFGHLPPRVRLWLSGGGSLDTWGT